MEHKQGYHAASGVVLKRSISADGDIVIDLFLKGIGRAPAVARGGGRGKVRFGGATEPFVWGNFQLYKGKGRFVLQSVDVKHDALKLRGSKDAILTAVRWVKLLIRHLEEGRADDKLLSCFYWSQMLLEDGIPAEMADWRFIWRWLKIWGMAPEEDDEILKFVAKSDYETVRKIKEISDPEHSNLLRNSSQHFSLLLEGA